MLFRSTVPVGDNPWGLAVTPEGARVYVANHGSHTVSVLSTATNTVLTTVPVGTNPRGLAITPDGAWVYVANYNSSTVSVIATATNTVVDTVPVGEYPIAFGQFLGPFITNGDFNADTHPDILLQNSVSGDSYVWYLDGVTITGGAYVLRGGDPAWQIVGPK